jgi:DNA-binding transcriptional LysR family regulator
MMKRTHLRQFLAVVETGGFTAAARRINVTQPTVGGIAELERLVGAPLFVRDRRNVRLTEAGNRLLAHARAIEREFRLAEASLRSEPTSPRRCAWASSHRCRRPSWPGWRASPGRNRWC